MGNIGECRRKHGGEIAFRVWGLGFRVCEQRWRVEDIGECRGQLGGGTAFSLAENFRFARVRVPKIEALLDHFWSFFSCVLDPTP